MSLLGAKRQVGRFVRVLDCKKWPLSSGDVCRIVNVEDYYGVRVTLQRVRFPDCYTCDVLYDIVRDKRRFEYVSEIEAIAFAQYGRWSPPVVQERFQLAA